MENTTTPYLEEEMDDPYIHQVSTEEFVETAERVSQEQNDDVNSPKEYQLHPDEGSMNVEPCK